MRVLAMSLLLICVLALPPVLAAAAAGPSRGATGPVLIVHAPWTDGARLAHASGGWPVGPQDAPLGTFATATDISEFKDRLRRAGAWAVLDGRVVALICGETLPRLADASPRLNGRIPTP